MIDETLGNYRITSLIGEGGMGVVYRAEHTLLGRKAAVKVLRSQISQDLVDRFFNEARAAAMLHHPSCVEVFDFGHRADGSAYIIMELLEGEPLSDRLEREARLQIPLASAIGRQVASALHVAHQQGIIHRDLKPGNIFLVPDTEAPGGIRAKVLDFGIAKLARDPIPRSVKTNSGAVFGTPRYMSPEQCRNARDVDGRADVYSLGCIFYEMLLGVAPFDYDSWGELVGAHLHETPPKPTELDPKLPYDVELVLMTALEKNPDDRYQTMLEFSQAIESLWRMHTSARTPFTPAVGIRAVSVETDDTLPPSSSGSTSSPRIPVSGSSPKIPVSGSSPKIPVPGSSSSGTKIPISRASSSPRIAIPSGVADTEPPPRPSDPSFADTEAARRSSAKPDFVRSVGTDDTAPPPSTPPAGNGAVINAPTLPREQEIATVAVTSSARRLPMVSLAGGALVLVGTGALIWVLAKRDAKKEDPGFVYVEQEKHDQPELAIDAAVALTTRPVQPPADAAVRTPRTPASPVKPPRAPVDPNETDKGALTRTFGHQQGAVQSCFRKYPQAITEAVSIRIKIDLAGHVTNAEVLPTQLASTPLGTCLADVARGTAFGAQPKPATFRVPIRTTVGTKP